MHSQDLPYAHNNIKPDNIMIAPRPGQEPLAILMDYEATTPAKKAIRSRAEALQLQVNIEIIKFIKGQYLSFIFLLISNVSNK